MQNSDVYSYHFHWGGSVRTFPKWATWGCVLLWAEDVQSPKDSGRALYLPLPCLGKLRQRGWSRKTAVVREKQSLGWLGEAQGAWPGPMCSDLSLWSWPNTCSSCKFPSSPVKPQTLTPFSWAQDSTYASTAYLGAPHICIKLNFSVYRSYANVINRMAKRIYEGKKGKGSCSYTPIGNAQNKYLLGIKMKNLVKFFLKEKKIMMIC